MLGTHIAHTLKSMGMQNVLYVEKLILHIQSLIDFVVHVSRETFIVMRFDITLNH